MIGEGITAEGARATVPANEILREITRGGLAGLIVGILLAGIGGRLVMRLAALLVPESAGQFTENGNRIGAITLGGSLGIVVLVGLLFGAVAGSLWVVLRPWLPSAAGPRALAAVPIAVALGTRGLVDGSNRDFVILERDPFVVASLILLVGLFGPALVLVEGWLQTRLPHPGPTDDRVIAGYTVVTMLGVLLTLVLVVPLFLGSDLRVAGVALLVVGLATLASWRLRVVGRTTPSWMAPVARVALVVAVVAGTWVTVGEVAQALRVA